MGDNDKRSTSIVPAPVYSGPARFFHWLTAGGVLVVVPLGLGMTYRGSTLDIWDSLTDALYSTHKGLGFLLLWLMAGRLIYRLLHGAPPDEPSLPRLQWRLARLVHWLLYGLLLIVPVLGWIGVSLYPALTLFSLVDLPALTAPDQELAQAVLRLHGNLAILTAIVATGHIALALYHSFVRRDGILRRMLPK